MAATRVRYEVLGLVCILSMITYLDRAAFPNAEKQIQSAMGGNLSQWAWTLAAFNLAYALFEVPTGYLGDVFGPRSTLIRIVLWWSFFTGLTALAGLEVAGFTFLGFWGLVLVRFLFGMGEAGAYPNITRALHNWLPVTERGWAQGLLWTTARFMGGITPLIWLICVDRVGIPWRFVFVGFGLLGVVWCVAFSLRFRNRPEEHSGVNSGELEIIRRGAIGTEAAHHDVPWARIFSSKAVWLLCCSYAAISFSWYFNLNYLPTVMRVVFEIKGGDVLGSVYKGGPLLLGAVGCLFGGLLTDRLMRNRYGGRWGRSIPGLAGTILAGFACIVAVLPLQLNSAVLFALAVALSGFFNDLTLAASWAACQDIGRKHAAIVAGTMNMIGNLGGFLGTVFTGWLISGFQQQYAIDHGIMLNENGSFSWNAEQERLASMTGYQINLAVNCFVYLFAAACWWGIDARRPISADEQDSNPGA